MFVKIYGLDLCVIYVFILEKTVLLPNQSVIHCIVRTEGSAKVIMTLSFANVMTSTLVKTVSSVHLISILLKIYVLVI